MDLRYKIPRLEFYSYPWQYYRYIPLQRLGISLILFSLHCDVLRLGFRLLPGSFIPFCPIDVTLRELHLGLSVSCAIQRSNYNQIVCLPCTAANRPPSPLGISVDPS